MRILDAGCASFDRPAELFPDEERLVARLDIDPAVHPDIVHDIAQPLPDELHGAFDVVVCSHVLEHLSWRTAVNALRNLTEAVTEGGKLWMIVPDFEWACGQVVSGKIDLGLMGTIFGGQDDPYDVHKCGWTRAAVTLALNEMGWKVIDQHRTGVNIIIMGKPFVSIQIVTEAERADPG